MNPRILCVIGTRPEAIKMAPVISVLKNWPGFDCRVLATAQHRHLMDQVLDIFDIVPDVDLNIMRPDQSLGSLTARLLLHLDEILQKEQPTVVLAQGDTTSVMAVALACFYQQIPFGHVEAGLRTGDFQIPYPEEMNRVIAGRLATWHFSPTEGARQNLLREGVPEGKIFVTGNTVIDTLLQVLEKGLSSSLSFDPSKRLILVTAHRRENFGEPFHEICRALTTIADKNNDVEILFPVHPNPNISSKAYIELEHHPRITLCAPLDYHDFVAAMKHSYLILTDSGGVQEEAPALGKPVLVLRSDTERPEAIKEGVVKLVGLQAQAITSNVQTLLDDPKAYQSMGKGVSPYGDGKASKRILDILIKELLK